MAYVKIGDILRHREPELVIAVSDVLRALAPENDVDEGQAFKALAQAANRRWVSWEKVGGDTMRL